MQTLTVETRGKASYQGNRSSYKRCTLQEAQAAAGRTVGHLARAGEGGQERLLGLKGQDPPPPHPQPSDDEGIESHGLLPVLNCSVTAVQNQTFAGAHTCTCVNAAARGPRARLPRPAPRAVRGHRQPAAPPGGKMMRLRG